MSNNLKTNIMKTKAQEKIDELNNGKVVRFCKNGWYYKFAKIDTMAAIVMIPEAQPDEYKLIEEIQMTGHCTIAEAELLIEHILK